MYIPEVPHSFANNPTISKQPLVHPSLEASDDESRLLVLFRKALTKSDVGNTSRIVLPKKEAEEYLPPLEDTIGIILAMEDLTYSMTWKFKYRFWPNNKSRMYVIENTGEFVKHYGLQQGDIFTVYKNRKTGNFVVHGERQIEEEDPYRVTFPESWGWLNMVNQSIKKVGQTPEGKRPKNKASTEPNNGSDYTSGSSTTTETGYFPRVSLNNRSEKSVAPSPSPSSLPDIDMDSFFESFLP